MSQMGQTKQRIYDKRVGGSVELVMKYFGTKLGKGSKTPIAAFCRKGGPPPPSPHNGKRPAKKLTEKNHGKGGYPPPPHHSKRLGIFSPKTAFFA